MDIVYRLGRKFSIWLNRTTNNRKDKITFSAHSHRMALEGKLSGYLRCLILDLFFAITESSHCKKSYDAWIKNNTEKSS
jgi:hypothetical protein